MKLYFIAIEFFRRSLYLQHPRVTPLFRTINVIVKVVSLHYSMLYAREFTINSQLFLFSSIHLHYTK